MKVESDNQHTELEEKFIRLIQNELNEDEKSELISLINSSPKIKAEFTATRELWSSLDTIKSPEAPAQMMSDFQSVLDNYKEEIKSSPFYSVSSGWARLKELLSYNPSLKWAYVLILLGTGSLLGYYWGTAGSPSLATNQEVKRLGDEVQEMKQMMMMSMLENPLATERIKAVSYTQELSEVNDQIIEALLTTLNHDENVNVRLVTLETLVALADHPKVREGLVQSLLKQESPLVQVALADVMIELQEKRSVKQMEQLLKKEGLNSLVKEKLEESIINLI